MTGVHFRQLFAFLKPPASEVVGAASRQHVQKFDFAISWHLLEGKETELSFHEAVNGPAGFIKRDRTLERNAVQLLFLQGFLFREWMKVLSSVYKIDPKYSRRHLDFLLTKDHHDLED